MSSAYLKSKMEERAGLADLVTTTLDRCAEESRDPSPDERARLDQWGAQIRALDGEIVQLRTALEANDRFVDVISAVSRSEEAAERRNADRARDEDRRDRRPRTFGEEFVESDAFKNYRGRGTMEPVEFEGFIENRAAIDLATLDLPPQLWSGPRGYVTTTPVLDVIGRERVSSNSVEYLFWGDGDAPASVVEEGQTKPEATMTVEPKPVVLKTYAHWKAITRQALEDYPRIRSIVEGKLRGGLANALETAAAGAILADTAIPTVTNANLLAGVREAVGRVQASGYQPNALLLNPQDYAALDIAAAEQSNAGPVRTAAFWGLRPAPAGAVPAGTIVVGDFVEGVTWFDRATAAVYMTDSHADFFVRNLLVVLAEQRAAFAVTEHNALAKVTATAAETARTASK